MLGRLKLRPLLATSIHSLRACCPLLASTSHVGSHVKIQGLRYPCSVHTASTCQVARDIDASVSGKLTCPLGHQVSRKSGPMGGICAGPHGHLLDRIQQGAEVTYPRFSWQAKALTPAQAASFCTGGTRDRKHNANPLLVTSHSQPLLLRSHFLFLFAPVTR
jgi:hypothetical protein